MEELHRANVPFILNKECIESFEILKKKLIKAPIMRFPNWSKKFRVHIDASAIAVRSIVTHPGDDHMDHPNAYASRKLNKVKRNYSATEREG